MIISIISFTEAGMELSLAIKDKMSEHMADLYSGKKALQREGIIPITESLMQWTQAQFDMGKPIIFIGAAGIAVRAVAPSLRSKLTDIPVIVLDEKGKFVIPLVSGHVGGANRLAMEISKKIGAEPVITTATDVNGKLAIDVWAGENLLNIENKSGIAKVSSKVLSGEMVKISSDYEIAGDFSDEFSLEDFHVNADVVISEDKNKGKQADLWLSPKKYVVGIGCRRNKEFEEIEEFIERKLKELKLSVRDISAVTSIDRKENEKALLLWSQKYHVPFVCFSDEELKKIEGVFSKSDFVKSQVGVENVCERAALAGCSLLYEQRDLWDIKSAKSKIGENKGELILNKQAENGMTIAVAEGKIRLRWRNRLYEEA